MKCKWLLGAVLIAGVCSSALAQKVTGELRRWHKVTVTFDGPNTSETANPNPFSDFNLQVTFKHNSSNRTFTVPGFFAACGDADNTSCKNGNKWRVHFTPDQTGTWSWTASFKKGSDVAINGGGSGAGFMDGEKGTLNIQESNKSGRDFRAKDKGRLAYVGEHYLRHVGTNPANPNGPWFIKAGADAPENTLAYEDFDDTPNRGKRRKSWNPHQKDYNSSDASSYTWKNGKGSELLGVVNYLANKGVNAFSFLTLSLHGDDENVFPYVLKVGVDTYNGYNDGQQWNQGVHKDRFDVSKLAQWENIFEYADKRGMFLHFKTLETENDNIMDGNKFGRQRKLYYRELIARFGHHLALNWNLAEESTIPDNVVRSTADYINKMDPYTNHIVLHTYPGEYNKRYTPLLGNKSKLTGPSIQTGNLSTVHKATKEWIDKSRNAGKKWAVAVDEPGTANIGIDADPKDTKRVRDEVLWGTLLAGGYGVEYYYGYQTGETDLTAQDHRSRDIKYSDAARALTFFNSYLLDDVTSMVSSDGVTKDNDDYVFAKAGEVYAIYRPKGGSTGLSLPSGNGNYEVQWFNPRGGSGLTNKSKLGSNLVAPDNNDWVALIRKAGKVTPPPPPTGGEECVAIESNGVVAVEAENFVKQSKTEKRQWYVQNGKNTTPKPDPDGDHSGSSSEKGYIEILPDTRVTHDDPLKQGESFSNTPGQVAILDYKVKFSSPGRYFVWVRAHSTGSEDNGIHVGIDGNWPDSGARMQWCAGKNQWTWESKQRTAANHCGEARKIFLDVPSAGVHTISFSMREDGFEFDKFVLSKAYTKPSGDGPKMVTDCGDGGQTETVDGGRVESDKGETNIVTITGDGKADVVNFTTSSKSKSEYIYVITDENGRILVTEDRNHDFEGVAVGICKIYGLSYTGSLQLSGKNISSANLASGKFDVSDNAIIVDRRKEATPPPPAPPTGATVTIPGTVEGEAFATKKGSVRKEDTPNSSGENLGFIKNGDYTDYNVKVAQSGTYKFTVYAASNTAGGTLTMSEGGKSVGSIKIPGNGNWHKYKTYTGTVALNANTKTLRMAFSGGAGFLFNVDKVEFEMEKATVETKTASLSPIHDAYLDNGKRYNTDLIRTEDGRRLSYLMFDISKIKGTIKDLALEFTITSDQGSGVINIYKGTTDNWTENNLSTGNAPKKGDKLGSANKTFKLDSKHTIKLQSAKISGNRLSLVVEHDNGNDIAFASKEHKNGKAPKLVITYEANQGARELELSSLIAYPNPTSGTVTLQGDFDDTLVEVYNVLGARLQSTQANDASVSLDLSAYPSGMYFVVVPNYNNRKEVIRVEKF